MMTLLVWEAKKLNLAAAIEKAHEILIDPEINRDQSVFLIISLYNEVIFPILEEMGWKEVYGRMSVVDWINERRSTPERRLYNCWGMVRDLRHDFGTPHPA